MRSLVLPPIAAVIDLHAALIEEHGGAPGLRDRGALEASLARPPITVFDLAAAVCFSICRNHPFVDGNKRIAFGALGMVLGLNGLYLDVAERDAAEMVLALAAGTLKEDAFRDWVAENSYEE